MKPVEMAKLFSEYLNEGTTPKGVKVQSFFQRLEDKDKKVVSNNVKRAFEAHLKEQKERADILKKKKKEVNDLKKRAKELGLKIVD